MYIDYGIVCFLGHWNSMLSMKIQTNFWKENLYIIPLNIVTTHLQFTSAKHFKLIPKQYYTIRICIKFCKPFQLIKEFFYKNKIIRATCLKESFQKSANPANQSKPNDNSVCQVNDRKLTRNREWTWSERKFNGIFIR